MTWRAALVGCGKIGSEFADDPRIKGIYTHAEAWRSCAGAELVAVCDSDAARARRCGERHGVADCYSDLETMLAAAQPDIVSICTPDDSHADVLGRVLAQPGIRAVLMEKPLALELETARALVAAASAKGVRLAVNYSRRYSHRHRELAQRLHAGEIGGIQHVTGFYTKGLLHNGTHWLDLARMLIGEVSAVTGFDRLREPGIDPTLDVRLEFSGGASATLHGLDASAYTLFEIDILGTKGRIRIADSGHRFEVFVVGDSPYYSGYRMLSSRGEEAGGMEDTLLHAVQDLVDALASGRAPLCQSDDAVAALAIGVAARASARAGGTRQQL